jgi:UDP-N-acetylmuramoyl-L-alanyl-D-glutamate--2,6-diaminopimelate ligase
MAAVPCEGDRAVNWAELRNALGAPGATPDAAVSRGANAIDGAEVTGIAYDSRAVRPGDVFVAMQGQRADGASFARDAIGRGAVAIVASRPPAVPVDVPWTIVADARLALAQLAAAFYGNPSRNLKVIGITGTNGKTTTAHLIASIFEAAGIGCGVLGTIAYRIGGDVLEAARTTPEAPDLQRLLRQMVDRGLGACAMEVSSHALSLRRVDAIAFGAGVFTNLTREHLDFHGDMEAYFQAKRRLFDLLPPGAPGVLNIDDPRGRALIATSRRPVTFALNQPADVVAGTISSSLDGLSFDVRTSRGDAVRVRSKLVGRPNVYNILAAVATAVALDQPGDAIERGVADLTAVPGRFQIVSRPDDEVTVVVDYAHTDDALKNLLETARALARGRLITVFGCGGDRDRSKRPLMGAVAGRLSDVIVVTSDNPRGERPGAIIDEILRGLTTDTRRLSAPREGRTARWTNEQSPARATTGTANEGLLTIVDRLDAIHKAIELARPGDVVLIAGKGHEKYQVIGDRVLPFDDVLVAREALTKRRTNSGVV